LQTCKLKHDFEACLKFAVGYGISEKRPLLRMDKRYLANFCKEFLKEVDASKNLSIAGRSSIESRLCYYMKGHRTKDIDSVIGEAMASNLCHAKENHAAVASAIVELVPKQWMPWANPAIANHTIDGLYGKDDESRKPILDAIKSLDPRAYDMIMGWRRQHPPKPDSTSQSTTDPQSDSPLGAQEGEEDHVADARRFGE
jgi:hypothetical protein